MKAPIRNRRILLDIGVAGPLAGFVVAVGVLIIGLMQSQLSTVTPPLPGCGLNIEAIQ